MLWFLLFPGSHTSGDFRNFMLWFQGWFMYSMRQQMMRTWESGTEEKIADDPEKFRRSKTSDFLSRAAMFAGAQAYIAKQDYDWNAMGMGLDVIVQGYWPLTKALFEVGWCCAESRTSCAIIPSCAIPCDHPVLVSETMSVTVLCTSMRKCSSCQQQSWRKWDNYSP